MRLLESFSNLLSQNFDSALNRRTVLDNIVIGRSCNYNASVAVFFLLESWKLIEFVQINVLCWTDQSFTHEILLDDQGPAMGRYTKLIVYDENGFADALWGLIRLSSRG